jgi:hypothetical protein
VILSRASRSMPPDRMGTIGARWLEDPVRAAASRSVPPTGFERKGHGGSRIPSVARASRSVPPTGFEPAHHAPEACALSPELRGPQQGG